MVYHDVGGDGVGALSVDGYHELLSVGVGAYHGSVAGITTLLELNGVGRGAGVVGCVVVALHVDGELCCSCVVGCFYRTTLGLLGVGELLGVVCLSAEVVGSLSVFEYALSVVGKSGEGVVVDELHVVHDELVASHVVAAVGEVVAGSEDDVDLLGDSVGSVVELSGERCPVGSIARDGAVDLSNARSTLRSGSSAALAVGHVDAEHLTVAVFHRHLHRVGADGIVGGNVGLRVGAFPKIGHYAGVLLRVFAVATLVVERDGVGTIVESLAAPSTTVGIFGILEDVLRVGRSPGCAEGEVGGHNLACFESIGRVGELHGIAATAFNLGTYACGTRAIEAAHVGDLPTGGLHVFVAQFLIAVEIFAIPGARVLPGFVERAVNLLCVDSCGGEKA